MASPYQRQDDFYEKPSASQATVVAPPPLPHHFETGRDSTDQYAMKDISVNSPSPYPVYNQNTSTPPLPPHNRFSDQHRDSLSDMKFIDHYDSDDDLEKIIPREKKRRSCMDKLCCGCCTCCPKWLRWCTCIFFIIILIFCIVVGVLAALFKVPKIDFSGLQQDPTITNTNNVLHMTFSVGISVDNPNFESITFETIRADAYYPAPLSVFIGGGNVTNLHIASNAVTNFTFPFSVSIDSQNPDQQGVIMDLMTKCGLDGSAQQNIKFDYYIYPTVRIAGIPITPQISQSMSIPCPLKGGDLTTLFGGLLQ